MDLRIHITIFPNCLDIYFMTSDSQSTDKKRNGHALFIVGMSVPYNKEDIFYESALSPTTPITISIKLTTLPVLFDSPKNTMLISTAPAVPTPIHTA